MYGKIRITGKIKSLTGLHIGGSTAFAAIGAVDSPVIRDVLSDRPMIPGSSLKGKMRSLLARQYSPGYAFNEHNKDDEKILRLFGNTADKKKPKSGRILFGDCFLSEESDKALKQYGISSTEVKFENVINRLSGIANPRQIERAIRGIRYNLNLIYNVENPEELEEDFKVLSDGFKLLELDYLGGHGSRGYGQVEFVDLDVSLVFGEVEGAKLPECKKILNEVTESKESRSIG